MSAVPITNKKVTWLWLGCCKLPQVVLRQFLVLFNDPNQANSLTKLKERKKVLDLSYSRKVHLITDI
jgi:hypothetical protein